MKSFSTICLAIFAIFNPLFSQVTLSGILSGANENPANASTATGKFEGIFDPWSRTIAFRLEFSGLTTPATASHFHSAPAGTNGPVVVDFGSQGFPVGQKSGEFVKVLTLTEAQAVDLMNGNFYANIHNPTFPGGEIRAQIIYGGSPANRVPISANLTGGQENPANASTATGTFDGIFDPFSRVIAFRLAFSGLTTNATASHFHNAPAGTNGPVVVDFVSQGFPVGVTSGEYVKVLTLTQAQADALAAGNLYVNIHNPTFPGGEIRGQLNYNKPLYRPAIPVTGTLTGGQENPANASTATGQFVGSFDPQRSLLAFKMTFSGLTANATASHIHRAPAGTNGPVIIDFVGLGFPVGVTSGTFYKIIQLSAAQVADLFAGNLYANIHNPTFPGGEIRAQLNAAPLKPAAENADDRGATIFRNLSFSIFPNPAHDLVFLNLEENDAVAHIQLFDAAGRLVSEKTTAETFVEWNVASLNAGFYFFRVQKGDAVAVRKWVKN